MRTKEEMYHLVDSWASSAKTQKEFCAELGIKSGTFSYWVGKKKVALSTSSGFVKLDTGSGSCPAVIEIVYPNGVKLTLQRSDLSLVSQLIRLY